MKATDLSIGDIGKTFRSTTYPNKNKTAKPSPVYDRESGRYTRGPRTWTIEEIWAHRNGNILINGRIYLRPDTDVERVEEND